MKRDWFFFTLGISIGGILGSVVGSIVSKYNALKNPPKEKTYYPSLVTLRKGKFGIFLNDDPRRGDPIMQYPEPFTYEPPKDEQTIIDQLLDKIGLIRKSKRGQKPLTLEEKISIMERWNKSELSVDEFCIKENIAPRTFYNYKSDLEKAQASLKDLKTTKK